MNPLSPPERFSTLNSITLWTCTVFIYLGIWIVLALNKVQISHEHGPMENAQAWCLVLGCFLFGILAWRSQSADYRILFGSLALFYASFVLREVEVEDLNIPEFFILLGSGDGKKYLLISCWLTAFGFFLGNFGSTWSAFKQWLKTPAGLTISIGGAFYLFGMPFDKKMFGLPYEENVLFEEMLESIATLWMLISAGMSILYFPEYTSKKVSHFGVQT